MKLNPGERSILAGFFQRTDAQAGRDALIRAGFTEVQLDRVSEYGFEAGADTERPIFPANAASQTGQILGRDNLGDDVRILLSATPAVSGMIGEVKQEPPYLVTIVTSEDRVEEALKIVREHRGKA